MIIQQFRRLNAAHGSDLRPDGLTEREMTVLELLASGKSNRQLSEILCLSERTVENHARSIYRKLGVHDRTQATLVAMQRGYVHLYSPATSERTVERYAPALR